MLIEDISASQILTAVLFIGALIAAQIYILRNKNSLKGRWASNQRVRLIDTIRLGPTEKLQIIKVDEGEYLYFFSKGNQPVVIPMHNTKKISSLDDNNVDVKSARNLKKVKLKAEEKKKSDPDHKIIQAISMARKQNPKVSFE